MQKILIRADSSSIIGAGHCMRSLSLLAGLRTQFPQISVVFLAAEILPSIKDRLQALEIEFKKLPSFSKAIADAQACIQLVEVEGPFDLVIVDHYQLDSEWEEKIRAIAKKIIAIDDLANRPHSSDLLLDQNYYLDAIMRYKDLCAPATKQLLGPSYALLRPEFKEKHSERKHSGKIEKVLLSLGCGENSQGFLMLLSALKSSALADAEIHLILGGESNARSDIEAAAQNFKNIRLYDFVEDMAQLILSADIGICGAGATTWESSCLGLPSIVYVIAQNQLKIAQDMDHYGSLQHMGWLKDFDADAFKQTIADLASKPEKLQWMSQRGLDLVDGRGVERICSAILDRGEN